MDQLVAKPAPRAAYADHTTRLIRNCWYVGALAGEVGRTPLARRVLGIALVLYRTQDGTAVVLRDRCPHRSFPLSKGKLDGDRLVCGYHGIEFAPDGQCAHMPALSNVPSHVRVQVFPVAERGPLLWVWMGDPARADEAAIPDTSWLGDAGWTTVQGQFAMRSNYVAMHENLLDQTHFSFLHADSVGTPEYAKAPLQVRQEGDAVLLRKELLNSSPPPIYGVPMGLTGRLVDRLSESGFMSPAVHVAHATITNHDLRAGERAANHVNIIHVITPATQDSFHYWWFVSRDFALDDLAASTFLREASARAYQEDVDALAWIQDNVTSDPDPFTEQSFAPDRPGLLMRRTLHRLAALED